ncbi:MAG: DUF979 domain-containing protein [Labilithrix sp.]|nr:DUF979 domain-containing protein [Labilithrix sp.]MCW5816207.1 DUF979 domain-containing protein [Labilithrix sp.]
MIRLEHVYVVVGLFLAAVAFLNARDATNPKRRTTALFWGAYAATLLVGSHLPDVANGLLVITMIVVGGLNRLDRGQPATSTNEERARSAERSGSRLFLPALLVPALTLGLTFGAKPLLDPVSASLVALALAALGALAVALLWFRPPAAAPVHEGRRLLDMIGWAAVIPQMLAVLGALFAAAGVGDRLAELLGRVVPLDQRLVVVVVFTTGMAGLTVVMGNAFAAFPIMASAVGIPILVRRLGGDPTVMAAIGMLSGFCGTLMTPMAANFNLVPAALLELPDKNGVIRAQTPTALALLGANTVLMYLLVFR